MNEMKIILPLPKAKLDHYPARNFFSDLRGDMELHAGLGLFRKFH